MYNKVNTNLNFVDKEIEIQNYWKDNNIFEKSMAMREGGTVFTFYDGPPTANGKPHIGHVITRVVKDIIPRYRTMKGYYVLRKAGWDTHGLPVELEVEKALGISGKPQIENYGVEPFINKCKESVWKYETEWKELSERVGFWVDMETPYVTYHNNYIESVWWALKKIWDKKLLYKGHKVVPYCPRCGTALSSHEVAQGYKDVKEESVYVKFKLLGTENEFFLAWTTTPWTLPSNTALVVNPKQNYVKVKANKFGEIYYLAEALVETLLTDNFEILETYKGRDLEGKEYETLYDFYKPDKKCCYICCDDYVTLSDGTGIVHMAPAFGEEDSRVGRIYDLPFVQLVNDQGNFVEDVKPWAGKFVKDADPLIIKDLEENGKLFKSQKYEHSYPFCWRCDTPLLYYARDAWFIRMTELRDQLVANNNTVNWLPENIKHGRFGNFLENVIDWSLSRERYWGTPLPIWECDCGHKHVVGSIKELQEMSTEPVAEDIELHKPYIDKVFLKCEKCGGKMKRVSEVIDCWFDSGSMPFAQWHYPFENEELFNQQFPADYISEAIDQTRGWFYTLMAISTLLFEKSSFKNCIVLGHILDKDGQKMSKHKGNVLDPWDVLNRQGVDAVRWYFMINSSPWLPSRFDEVAVSEAHRRFMGTLWNTYAFYVLYANIDEFNPMEYKLEKDKLNPMDLWIFSKLNTLIKYVDESLENYKLREPASAMNEFVDQLSNWYVRRSRERFWGKDMTQDKINAYMTLYTVLLELIKLAAPYVPFITEEIYGNLVKSVDKNALESVHFCDFPSVDFGYINNELEHNMDTALNIVVLGRAARNNANIKNRQPIGKMYVKMQEKHLPEDFVTIIAEELNIKNVEFVNDTSNFTTYTFKPQLRTLGPKYGKLVPAIGEVLKTVDGNDFMSKIKLGEVKLSVEGTEVVLTEVDVLAESGQMTGYMSETDKGITIVLDTNLSDLLIEEGFVREIISKLQTMRKEAGFEVLDHIHVYICGNHKIADIMLRNKELIMNEVLAVSIRDEKEPCDSQGYSKKWNINGQDVDFCVSKL